MMKCATCPKRIYGIIHTPHTQISTCNSIHKQPYQKLTTQTHARVRARKHWLRPFPSLLSIASGYILPVMFSWSAALVACLATVPCTRNLELGTGVTPPPPTRPPSQLLRLPILPPRLPFIRHHFPGMRSDQAYVGGFGGK